MPPRRRRPQYELAASFDLGQAPTTKEAQSIADELYADFVSQDVDKVLTTCLQRSVEADD